MTNLPLIIFLVGLIVLLTHDTTTFLEFGRMTLDDKILHFSFNRVDSLDSKGRTTRSYTGQIDFGLMLASEFDHLVRARLEMVRIIRAFFPGLPDTYRLTEETLEVQPFSNTIVFHLVYQEP